jgi:FixH
MDYFSADADAWTDGALTVLRALFHLSLVVVALAAQACPALADGGIVQMQRSSGQFVITVFTAPVPLRAGPADISIMIQDSNNHPVLDADVTVILHREGGESIKAEAKRGQSKNRLLYTALLSLPEAGRWEIEVAVVRNTEKTRISGVMMVAPPRSFLLTYWWTLAIPPVAIGLFIINQWLKAKIHHKKHKMTKGTKRSET